MPRRLIHLDLLRAVAVLLVLGAHQTPHDRPVSLDYGWLRAPLDLWMRIGWIGVDLFFVLSGFLIGGLLLNEYRSRGTINVSRFYIRRIFKIWPPYLLWLGAVMIAVSIWRRDLLQESPWMPIGALWQNFLHVQNYFIQAGYEGVWNSVASHTWSLAIEEHFYLFLPALLLAVAAWGRRSAGLTMSALPKALIVVILAAIGGRLYVGLTSDVALHPGHWAETYAVWNPTHLRIDELAVGVLLAYFVNFMPEMAKRAQRWRLAALLFGIACFALMAFLPPHWDEDPNIARLVYVVGISVLSLGSVGLVFWAWCASAGEHEQSGSVADDDAHLSLPIRWLATIGVSSYSIYLWHVPFGKYVGLRLGEITHASDNMLTQAACILVYLIASVVLGIVMNRLVERPALFLRNRWFPSRATPPKVSTSSAPAGTLNEANAASMGA